VSHECSAEDINGATRRLDVATSGLMVTLSRTIGINVPEMLAPESWDVDGSSGPTELAHRLRMTSGAMTALVDRLAGSGYVLRERFLVDRRGILFARPQEASEDLSVVVSPPTMKFLELAESLSGTERQAVGRFFGGFIAVIENTVAETCTTTGRPRRTDLAVASDGARY
jgi:hypothetical protein